MTDNQFNKLQHNDRNILISFCQWTEQKQNNFLTFCAFYNKINGEGISKLSIIDNKVSMILININTLF